MDEPDNSVPKIPLAHIEPHAKLLVQPSDDALLYKVMTAEDFVASVRERYLHFNRVDSYKDFSGADGMDGLQLDGDRDGNHLAKFTGNREFTAADYYDQSRARTYACCFSLENSNHIWSAYGNGSTHGKVGVIFRFGQLRSMLNEICNSDSKNVVSSVGMLQNFFSINYGCIQYVDRKDHRQNQTRLPNPIIYTFQKDQEFAEEKELRVSLSAFGLGKYVAKGMEIEFPTSLRVAFDFRQALEVGAVVRIEKLPDTDWEWIRDELDKTGIRIEAGQP